MGHPTSCSLLNLQVSTAGSCLLAGAGRTSLLWSGQSSAERCDQRSVQSCLRGSQPWLLRLRTLFPCKNPSRPDPSFLTWEHRPIPALWTDSTRGAVRSLPPCCRPLASGLHGSDGPAPRHLEGDISPETCSCPAGGRHPRAQSAGQPGPVHLGGLPSASARAADCLPPCRALAVGPGPWRLGNSLCGLLIPCVPAPSVL